MADSSSRHIRRHCSRGASNLRPFGYGSTLKLTALSRLYILFIFFVNSIYFLRKFVNRPPMAPPTSHQIYKIISLCGCKPQHRFSLVIGNVIASCYRGEELCLRLVTDAADGSRMRSVAAAQSVGQIS